MTPDKHKLLIVDDDHKLRTLLGQFLTEKGYHVTLCEDGTHALETLERDSFSLMILDVMMPGLSGLDVMQCLQHTRSQQQNRSLQMPVLMLTALDDVEDRIKGLSSGADDYLPKPFDTRELLLRIEKQLNRTMAGPKTTGNSIQIGTLIFDLQTKVLSREQHVIPLTTTEETLLSVLAAAGGAPVSRDDLAAGAGYALSPRTIDVQINRLRRTLDTGQKENDASQHADPSPTLIKTVRHKGYALLITSETPLSPNS